MKINVKKDDSLQYYESILKVLSALSPKDKALSKTEAAILARFMVLPKDYLLFPFSRQARRLIKNTYTDKYSRQNIGVKLYSMLKKGYLIRDEDGMLDFHPHIRKLLNTTSIDAHIYYGSSD